VYDSHMPSRHKRSACKYRKHATLTCMPGLARYRSMNVPLRAAAKPRCRLAHLRVPPHQADCFAVVLSCCNRPESRRSTRRKMLPFLLTAAPSICKKHCNPSAMAPSSCTRVSLSLSGLAFPIAQSSHHPGPSCGFVPGHAPRFETDSSHTRVNLLRTSYTHTPGPRHAPSFFSALGKGPWTNDCFHIG
jgi:hypothetical protein